MYHDTQSISIRRSISIRPRYAIRDTPEYRSWKYRPLHGHGVPTGPYQRTAGVYIGTAPNANGSHATALLVCCAGHWIPGHGAICCMRPHLSGPWHTPPQPLTGPKPKINGTEPEIIYLPLASMLLSAEYYYKGASRGHLESGLESYPRFPPL